MKLFAGRPVECSMIALRPQEMPDRRDWIVQSPAWTEAEAALSMHCRWLLRYSEQLLSYKTECTMQLSSNWMHQYSCSRLDVAWSVEPNSCLHHLLPPSRDTSVISRLYVLPHLSFVQSHEPKSSNHFSVLLSITNPLSRCHSSSFICYYCATVNVVTVFICTCFLFCIANLLFSYSATQLQVWNKTQCQCQFEAFWACCGAAIVDWGRAVSAELQ